MTDLTYYSTNLIYRFEKKKKKTRGVSFCIAVQLHNMTSLYGVNLYNWSKSIKSIIVENTII